MFIYRWFKHRAFMNREFRRYTFYALGEIGLVIVGILLALQVDAWWESQQAQEDLDRYLQAIADDIASDIERLEQLKRDRVAAFLEARGVLYSIGDARPESMASWLDRELVRLASRAINTAQRQVYFVPNLGSYRGLESSGLMSQLSEARTKRLLFDYYRTVDRISNLERDMNNRLRDLSITYEARLGERLFIFFQEEPVLLWGDPFESDSDSVSESRLAGQRYYGEVLASGETAALLKASVSQPLLQEYEHLLTTGRALLMAVQQGGDGADMPIFRRGDGRGFDMIFENGLPAMHSVGLFTAPACPGFADECFFITQGRFDPEQRAFVINYAGGQPWAFIYARTGSISPTEERQGLDFSDYRQIQLELKRTGECPSVEVVLKDAEDPDDGTERKVRLQPESEWTKYTIDLDEFADADLTRLHVVAGFLFEQEPCHLAIRDVRYL
ncbi:MAG: DUF6090 family protein [Xanthomonadales bacterium]|nr:DUF6090 family protein [Xanthomonadales bacterium]